MSLKVQLMNAIREGDNIKVSNLLEVMDISAVNERTDQRHGRQATALHIACGRNNDRALSLLLDQPGIDVNAQNTLGATPLHVACRQNHDQKVVARLLATPGIDVNVKDNSGCTPIMEAAEFRNRETFKLMLHDHRVDLDVKDNKGRGLEKIVGGWRSSIYSEKDKKYVDLIKEERKKKKNVYKKKNEESTNIVIEKIQKINNKIKDSEQRWTEVTEKQELESEKLARKHQEEKVKQELEREKLAKKHQEEKTQQEKTFAREAETNKQHTAILTEMRNELAQDLEKIHFDKGKYDAANNNDDHYNLESARRSLECPICLESMQPPKRIWMCIRTHSICEACKILLNGKPCPTCKSEKVNLRAYMIEKMAEIVFNKSKV